MMNPRGETSPRVSCTEHFFYWKERRWKCDSCSDEITQQLMNRIIEREVDITAGIGLHVWEGQVNQAKEYKYYEKSG